jgi:transposase
LAGKSYEEIGAEFGVGAAMARVRAARHAATLGQTRPRGRPRQMDRPRDL